MTTEDKIKVLELSKTLLKENYLEYGICGAFLRAFKYAYDSGVIEKPIGNNNRLTYHLGDIFIKHRPNNIFNNDVLWWGKNEDGLKIRLSIIDEMILELKKQIQS